MASLLNLYQKLKQKLAEEKEYIKSEAFTELKDIIAKKSDLMTEIEKKEAAIKAGEAEKIQESELEKIKEILSEASKLQEQNMELLNKKKGETQTKLLDLYGRKKSIKGYYNKGHQEAKFFDEKS